MDDWTSSSGVLAEAEVQSLLHEILPRVVYPAFKFKLVSIIAFWILISSFLLKS